MNLPSKTARTVSSLALLWASSPSAWAHGRGFALGDAPSPAARGMALAMVALIVLVISGVAALALYLRHKANHPSPVQKVLDHLQTEIRPPSPEASVKDQETPASEAWSRSPDWWKQKNP